MSQASIARQPIFDRDLNVVGYELLFRSPPATTAEIVDQSVATTNVILTTLTEIGLDRVAGGQPAWINASRDFLLSGLVTTLPPDRVALEILEDQEIDDLLVTRVAALVSEGYHFALDDFEFTEHAPRLLELVDVVKLDLLALGRVGLADHARRLEPYGVTLLAEKVETPEDHAYCLAQGCDRFQGFFYHKPELLSGRRIGASRVSLLQILAALQSPSADLDEVERLIGHDVALSLRLLRYINSAFFGLRHRVTSVGQAIALLGGRNLKQWATLSVFAGLDNKPSELTRTALIRARFCELAAAELTAGEAPQMFTLGLFSVIDALMDMPIEEALGALPFPDDMRRALGSRDGAMGALLESVTALEHGDFDRAQALVPHAEALYLRSLDWADETARELFEESVLTSMPTIA